MTLMQIPARRRRPETVDAEPSGAEAALAGDSHTPSTSHPRRDWWVADVLVLTLTTGMVEAVCLAHLGGVFAAFATGTVVLAGVHVGSGSGDLSALLPYGVAFAGFLIGGLLGGALVRNRGVGNRARIYLRALLAEAALIGAAGIELTVTSGERVDKLAALAVLAAAMSVQFSATRFVNLPDLRFAAATGLVHGLVHDVTASGAVPVRLSRRLAAVLALPAGAAIGAAIALVSVGTAVTVLGAALAGHRLGQRS